MKEFLSTYFSKGYLLVPVDSAKYNDFYLWLSILLLVLPITIKIFIRVKGVERPTKVYGAFDNAWFWSSFTLSLIGLFIYFSRTQSLSLFGTRLASYLFLLAIPLTSGILFLYYKTKIPTALKKHYEKSRKKKYLKSK